MLFDYIVSAALVTGLWVVCLVMIWACLRRLVGSGSRALCAILEGLAVSARRNMPMPVALRLLAEDSPRRFRPLLDMAATRSAAGESLGDALKSLGTHIPSACTTAISACERHGGLAEVLDSVARQQATKAAARERATSFAAYPVFVAFYSFIVVSGIMVFIMPMFGQMFQEMEFQLPGLTRALIGLSRFCSEHSLSVLLLLAGCLSAVIILYATAVYRWPFAFLAKPVDYLLFAVPCLRRYLIHSGAAQMAQSVAVALRAGAPLHQALWAAADIDLPGPLRKRIVRAAQRVEQGGKLAESARELGMFPHTFVCLARLGEEAGELPASCERIAAMLGDRAERMLRYATALIFPFSIVAIAVAEALVILALFLPLVYLAGSTW